MWFDSLNVFTTMLLARLGTGGVVGLIGAAIIFINGAVALKSTTMVPTPRTVCWFSESSLNQMNLLIPVGVVALLLGLSSACLVWSSGKHASLVGRSPAIFLERTSIILKRCSVSMLSCLSAVAAAGALDRFHSVGHSVRRCLLPTRCRGVSMREIDGRFNQGAAIHAPVRKHLGALVSIWLLLLSISAVLSRYTLMYDQSGLFAGPGYSDLYGTLPSLYVKAAGLAIAAVLVGIGVSRAQVRWAVSGAIFGAAGWALAHRGFIQHQVEPNVQPLKCRKSTTHCWHR